MRFWKLIELLVEQNNIGDILKQSRRTFSSKMNNLGVSQTKYPEHNPDFFKIWEKEILDTVNIIIHNKKFKQYPITISTSTINEVEKQIEHQIIRQGFSDFTPIADFYNILAQKITESVINQRKQTMTNLGYTDTENLDSI